MLRCILFFIIIINSNLVCGQFFNGKFITGEKLFEQLNMPNDLKCRICKKNPGKCNICEGTKKCVFCKGKKSEQFHFGECPNCKTWNNSYRNQVPCHRCKNTRNVKLAGCFYCLNKPGFCTTCKGIGNCIPCKGKGEYNFSNTKQIANLKLLPTLDECEINVVLIADLYKGTKMLKTISYANGSPFYKYDKIENKVYNLKGDLVTIGLEGGDRFYNVSTQRFSFDYFRDLPDQSISNAKNRMVNIIDNLKPYNDFKEFPYGWFSDERNFEFIATVKDEIKDWEYYGLFIVNKNKIKECNVLAKTLALDKKLVENFVKDMKNQVDYIY